MRQLKLKLNNKSKYLALSFLIPFFTYFIAYAIQGVFPFGDRQIMISDFWHQYYPFICELQNKLQTGESLLYTFNGGLGVNFISLASYYLMSPLNLLTILVPSWALKQTVTIIVLIKMGLAGLTMGIFLQKMFRKIDITTSIFASMYALSAFAIGYGWNIMWLDSFYMMPLVALGTILLVKEGKCRLYIFSLFVALFSNYYIGFVVCIFTFITFFATSICAKINWKTFFRRLINIAFYSLIAILMTAVITIPAYIGLKHTYSIDTVFPDKLKLYESFLDILGNLNYVTLPSVVEGLPNIYCGMVCVFLMPLYVLNKKINIKEKLLSLSVLVFLFLSLNINIINFVWHAFHETNMIPYRFSFTFSFVLIILAYRGFRCVKDINFTSILISTIFTAIILTFGLLGPQNKWGILGGAIALLLYSITLFFSIKKTKKHNKYIGIFILLIFLEVTSNTLITFGNTGTSHNSSYPADKENVDILLSEIDENNHDRIEMNDWYSTNDPFLYGYRGVSHFFP